MYSKRIHCTVYLEGINVNFNSIQIHEQAGMPPRATVSFPADSAALTILPKTVIHVFYTDDVGQEVLIFMGELSGSGISFSGDRRSIQLVFNGLSQNWKTNLVIPLDVKVRTMLSRSLYAQITTNFNSNLTGGSTNANKIPYVGAPRKTWDEVKGYIAKHESAGVPTAVNTANKNGTQDTGLYQINDVHLEQNGDNSKCRKAIDSIFFHMAGLTELATVEAKQKALKDPAINEAVARTIYENYGLSAWSTERKVLTDIALNEPSNTMNRNIEATIFSTDMNTPNEITADVFQFANLEGTSPLDPLIDKLVNEEEHLFNVLKTLIATFSTGYTGVYWSMLSKAFQFDKMVAIDGHVGIYEIEKLLRTVATVQHIKGLANGISGIRTIHDIFMTILSSVGFDYSEIAAPTYLADEDIRAHILVKPQTHFFPPLRQNLVVDDNIAQLNFSRDFDNEPTRLLAQTVPFGLTGTDFQQSIIGVVIPANIRVTTGITASIKNQQDYDNLKMFGLSQEEQCRGVVLTEYQDKTNIENSYLIAVAEDTQKVDGIKTLDTLIEGGEEEQDLRRDLSKLFPTDILYPGTSMLSTQQYHANIASIQYYNARHANRTIQVSSPYSPYRMVGFPGVVLSNYFPSATPGIMGTVDSITSNISADGDASQVLIFTHCRLVDDNEDTQAKLGFLDDHISTPIPWYATYTKQENINTFYRQFTGKDNSAVIDTKESDPKKAVLSEIKKIKKEMILSTNKTGETIAEYILRITARPLVTSTMIKTLFPKNKTRKLITTPKVAYADTEIVPYVVERQDRVKKVFDIV